MFSHLAELKNDPFWFKDTIIYEVPVRAFFDNNHDGIGDFCGLAEKLDYLQDLGITAIWVLPFFASPLKDDGYDISEYTCVNSIYGNLDDFKSFLKAAHQRDIRVIIELILNHTSDQHLWFQRARRAAEGSVDRDFYVWSNTAEKYPEARIIFQDFESSNWAWDAVANAYYWHRFYAHQPDLNYDNPAVCEAVFEVLDFWLEMGVDGLRLDAVPYLYERDGTNCENLPETHHFLKRIRQYIDERYPNRMLLAEANQWFEDAVEYFGNGDECHMNFHFPLMPRLFMSLRMEDSFAIVDILQQTPAIPNNCQWALFLRNHDELTLEMVTEEDRDFMYRVYAQDPEMRHNLGIRRRLAPLLDNDRRQIELLNSLLLSLPGTPVLYYGDEIGMGDNLSVGDRNGVRTPMQWSGDRNAGFSEADPQQLYLPVIVDAEYRYSAVNVEAQRANPNSLWQAIKRLITTRKRHKALAKGTFELLYPDNHRVLAFTRTEDNQQVLVVANLSRFVQTVELNLSNCKGRVPIEMFGQTEFPVITDQPYFLSLSPYACYWLDLQLNLIQPPHPPTLTISDSWPCLLTQQESKTALEAILADYLVTCSWFNRAQKVQATQVTEVIPVLSQTLDAQIVWLQVDYFHGNSETCLLMLAYVEGEQAIQRLAEPLSSRIVARLQIQQKETTAILLDVCVEHSPNDLLFNQILNHDRIYRGISGELVAVIIDLPSDERTPVNKAQSEDDSITLKLFNFVEEGIHPDIEVRQFLGDKKYLQHIVPLVGQLEYRRSHAESMTIATLQPRLQGQNGWDYSLESLHDFFECTAIQTTTNVPVPSGSLLDLSTFEIPDLAAQLIDPYLASVQQLGQSTAELHRALASDSENSDFTPQPFSSLYQRSLYQQSRNLTGQVFRLLKERLDTLPPTIQPMAQAVLDRHEEFLEQFRLTIAHKIMAQRIRCHGDYQLEQLLYTGKDFIVLNFEGERGRSLSEGRIKRSPFRDVASMLLSFHEVSRVALTHQIETGSIRPETLPLVEQWAQFWVSWVSAAFLKHYLATAQPDRFLPKTHAEMAVLLDACLLEKAIFNLGACLSGAPDRAQIWLQQLLQF